MDVAVGIDVGFSAAKRSTGVVILDRSTRTIADGSRIAVATAADALRFVRTELRRLEPTTVTFCVDGPFAAALPGSGARHVERFFARGPFASAASPRMRLSPAPTGQGSPFLAATSAIVDGLRAEGFQPATLANARLSGDIIEIFPTIFLGSLLPPHGYSGKRNAHTDDLWAKAIGVNPAGTAAAVRVGLFSPFDALISAVEAAPPADRHDARMAAVCAIAADAAAGRSSNVSAIGFIGHPVEHGFVMPPRASIDAAFAKVMDDHWQRAGGAPLVWL